MIVTPIDLLMFTKPNPNTNPTSHGWNVAARLPCDNIYCFTREFKSVVARTCVYGGFMRVFGGGVKIVVIREFVCDVTREFCDPVRVFDKLPLETPVRNSRTTQYTTPV